MSLNYELANDEIDHIIANNSKVDIFLKTGIKLSGKIIQHDDYCIVFNCILNRQIIFKHAVSTIVENKNEST